LADGLHHKQNGAQVEKFVFTRFLIGFNAIPTFFLSPLPYKYASFPQKMSHLLISPLLQRCVSIVGLS